MHLLIQEWTTVILYYWAGPQILWKSSSWSKMLQPEFWWELTGETIFLQLASLHWLPVKFRIEFKILLLTYKALNDRAPSYLKDLIIGYFPNRALCSQTAGLLVVPRVSNSRMRGRDFSYQAPLCGTPRSDCAMLRETLKKPRATSQTLQASVSMLKVKVHDSTVRKRLNKDGLFGRAAGESLFSVKEHGSTA